MNMDYWYSNSVQYVSDAYIYCCHTLQRMFIEFI